MSEDTGTNIDEAMERLRAALERDQWINLHSYPVDIRSEDDRLIMEGTVENVAAKRRARILAEEVAGERWPIDDRLRREPTEKQGDREIRDQVIDRLSSESMFREYSLGTHTGEKSETIRDADASNHEIVVHVDNAAVKLTGTVGSLTHRRFAEVLVWWTYGCETVENGLGVTPAEEDTDAEISDAVRIVFEKDPMFDADQFHVGTSDGVVTLEGLAASEMVKKYAVMDIWSIPGVRDVVDNSTVMGSEPT